MTTATKLWLGKKYRIQYGCSATYEGIVQGVADNVVINNPVYPEAGNITTDLYTIKDDAGRIRSLYSCHMLDVTEMQDKLNTRKKTMKTATASADHNTLESVFLKIAQKHIYGLCTLEERRMDSLDFHEIGVTGMKEALREAYEAGVAVGVAAGRASK